MEDLIRIILVDDDEEALMLLENYLKALPEIDLIGKTTSGANGLELIREKLPDLVFLDIDMPDLNGIEIARIIKEKNYKTQVVFTTAFNDYAYDAISTEPLDYLVKPFGPENLIPAIQRFRQKQNKEEDDRKFEVLIQSQKTYGKVKFPTRQGVIILHADDVALMRAQGNSCELFLSDGSVEIVNITLNKVATAFRNPNIYRISRSSAINLKFLRRVDRKNKLCIISINGTNFEESLSRQNINFFEKLKCFPIS